MESKEELNAESASSKGPAELVATQPGLATATASVAMEKAETTYFQYCNDDFPLEPSSTQVGTIPLIVENILRYCDYETLLASTRVNHLWRNLAIPSVTLRGEWNDENTNGCLQKIGNLTPFIHLELYGGILPQNWINYSANLVTLRLSNIFIERSTEIFELIFNSFPSLKLLVLENVEVKEKVILQDFQMPTPKLESLFVGEFYSEEDNFITSDFCVKVLSKLRNLKTLHIDAPNSPHSIPFFSALTKGNIKLENLKYCLGGERQPQSSAVINKYLRDCGESLRRLSLAFNSTLPIRPDIFRGYAGKNLNYLHLWENNHRLTLNKDAQGGFQLSLRVDDVQNFPNISEVSLRGTYDDFSQPLPSIESPVVGSLSVDYVGVEFDTTEHQVDEQSREARNALFVLFPNVLHLTLKASGGNVEGVVDFVKEVGRNWPHLRSFSVQGLCNTAWNCDKWRRVIAHVVLNLRDLEDVSFIDSDTYFDTTAIVHVLLLPKLKHLHVMQLKISSRLHDMLTNRLNELESTKLTLED